MTHEQADNLLRAACEFQGQGIEARENCRGEYRSKETNSENILRVLIDGLIAWMAKSVTQKINGVNAETSYQIGLSASFIRTHFLISDFIMDGDLVESLVLIRKQFESLARLHELDSKPLHKLAGKERPKNNFL